jgi:hypothetical protein
MAGVRTSCPDTLDCPDKGAQSIAGRREVAVSARLQCVGPAITFVADQLVEFHLPPIWQSRWTGLQFSVGPTKVMTVSAIRATVGKR